MAAELDFQAIIDLVGDKLREVFPRATSASSGGTRTRASSTIYTCTSTACESAPEPTPLDRGGAVARRHVPARAAGHQQPRRVRCPRHRHAAGHRSPDRSHQVERVRAGLQRRARPGFDRARELRARERVRRVRGPAAEYRGREHGRGAGERAPLRRNAAPAEGNRAAQRRAGGDQQHPGRHRGRSTSRRSSTSSATSCARCCTRRTWGSAGGPARRTVHFLYRVRARRTPARCAGERRYVRDTAGNRFKVEPPTSCGAGRREVGARVARGRGTDMRASSLRRADLRRATSSGLDRPGELTSATTPSATPTCGCCNGRRRAWASRWRTRASSTRRSAC